MFIRLADLAYPRHEGDVRLEHPQFDGINLPDGWAAVEPTEPPTTVDQQVLQEIAPELVNGTWEQRWTILKLTKEEWDGLIEKSKADPWD